MTQPPDTADQEFLQLYGPEAWNDWQRLLAHFDLAEGFSFLVLLLPGAVGADICRRQLTAHLAAQGKRLAELPCDWREDARRLADRLFALAPADDLGGIWLGSVVPESDPEIKAWQDAWRLGLASLNQQRNPLLQRFRCPLVLVGAPWLNPLLREAAPDLWSVRAAVVIVTPAPAVAQTSAVMSHEMQPMLAMSGEAASDPDYALEQAECLRDKPGYESARAELLFRAGNGFCDHARHEPAERCFREAATIFESLPLKTPKIQAEWAGALNNLANVLSALGRREEALEKAQVATRIYDQLAQVQPEAYRPYLATSLNNLARTLSALGRLEESLGKIQEAAQIYEQLAKVRPGAFLPNLAMSLNNLATSLSALGHRQEALEKAQASTRIYEQLAQARPGTFLPDVAMSLNNLASSLSELGRREEALEQARAATRIFEHLAHARPDAFLRDVAMSRNNLANMLSALGWKEEALEHAQASVRIREHLAEARPDVFLPDLATSLNNLASTLSDLGRREEALDQAQASARIFERLAHTQPDVFLPNLAASLNNVANRLSDLGRREEALKQAQAAVRIAEQLAQRRPDAFLPELARSYGTRGAVLQGMKQHAEAADSFAEGVRTLTPFFRELPSAFAQLIGDLARDYLKSVDQAQQQPETALLAPVLEVFQKLQLNPPTGKDISVSTPDHPPPGMSGGL